MGKHKQSAIKHLKCSYTLITLSLSLFVCKSCFLFTDQNLHNSVAFILCHFVWNVADYVCCFVGKKKEDFSLPFYWHLALKNEYSSKSKE